MDFERHQNDLRMQRKSNRTLGAIVVLLSAVPTALAGRHRRPGRQRAHRHRSAEHRPTFWVTRDKASREYLEQMAGYVAWLMLDVSPSTIDWKRNVLLNYVAPDQHAAMKTKMDLEADRLRSNNAATSFLVQQFTANEKEQSVVVAGRLRRQINGADIGEPETRAYLAQFEYAGGRVHIKTFKEIAVWTEWPSFASALPMPALLIPALWIADVALGPGPAGRRRQRRRHRRGRAVDQGADAHPHRRRADHRTCSATSTRATAGRPSRPRPAV